MSFYNNDAEIIDLTMDVDSDPLPSSQPSFNHSPELITSPNPIYNYPTQRFNSKPSKATLSSKVNSQSNRVAKYTYETMPKKPRTNNKNNSLKDFIVDDDEIEEEIAKGATVAAKKYPEIILDHKYDVDQLVYLVKWDILPLSGNSWENAQTINDTVMLSTYWEAWKRKRKSLGHPSTQNYYNSKENNEDENDEYELIYKCPNTIAYTDPDILVNWNEEIDEIESIQYNEPDQLIVYVLWKSGLRSVHLLDELHEKAPKKMCKWYYAHIGFLNNKNLLHKLS